MKTKHIALALLVVAFQVQGVEVKPQARGYVDYASYHNDDLSLNDTFIIRSARVGAKVDFLNDWQFRVSYELADAIADKHTSADEHNFKAGIKNLNVSYRAFSNAKISLGQQKLPFSLEQSIGSSSLPFMESSLVSQAFSPPRRLAFGIDGDYIGLTYSASLYGRSIDGRHTGNGVIGRSTYAFKPNDSLVHLGAAINHGTIRNREDKSSDFDAYPEVQVAPYKYVNTGRIKGADTRNDINLEAAWQRGALIVQTEATHSSVARTDRQDVSFYGWYTGLSWFLNGESKLKYKKGKFGDVEKLYSDGVWQVNARYSYVNLNSKNILGGEQENFTLGLTYYFNQSYRLMMKLTKVRSDYEGEQHAPFIGALRLQVNY